MSTPDATAVAPQFPATDEGVAVILRMLKDDLRSMGSSPAFDAYQKALSYAIDRLSQG